MLERQAPSLTVLPPDPPFQKLVYWGGLGSPFKESEICWLFQVNGGEAQGKFTAGAWSARAKV